MKRISLILIFLCGLTFAQRPNNYFQGAQVVQIVSHNDEIWFCTYGRGILRFNKTTESWSQINSANSGLKDDRLYCLAVDDDYIWAGTSEGLWIQNRSTNQWSLKKFSKGGQFGLWIRTLLYDEKSKVLWVGRFKFLSRFDKRTNSWSDFDLTVGKDEQSNSITTLWIDSKSNLWVGSESGLHKINTQQLGSSRFEFFSPTNSNIKYDGDQFSISVIKNDSKNLWVGISEFITPERPRFITGGLYNFDSKKNWRRIDIQSGLPGNGIYSISSFGSYLIVGVYDFIPHNKEQEGKGLVLIHKGTGEMIRLTAKQVGFTNDKILSMYFDGESIWFGTYSGISRLKFTNDFIFNFKK